MRLEISSILVVFYFMYWIIHDKEPFNFLWLIFLVIGIFIFETIIVSILKSSAKTIKKEGKKIGDSIKEFDNRLNILESKIKN